MPRRAKRPEGEDSSLALDTRSRAVIQQLVDEKRAALEAAAPHIPLEEYLHGGQDSLQSSIKRMRDAAASFASAGELVAPAAPAAPAADDTARAHHSTDVAGSGTLGPGSATRRPASAPHSRTGAMGQRGAAGGTGEAPSLQRPSGHARARAERLQEEVRLREETECTFHPRTNLAVPTVRVADPNAFFERSAKWREERERRIEAQKRRAEARKLQECTFKPHTARRGRGTPAAGGRAAPQVAKASFAASSPGSGAAAPAVASMAAASERLYSEAQARLVQRQLASQQRGAPLAPSPPAAAAVTECVRNPRNAELRRAAADDADCPFAPQTNGPKRSTSAATLGVTSRYRKQSPARPARALPSGEEHCTFTPRVNRVPRRLSEAAAGYLGDGAFDRLSRVPPPPPDAASAPGVDRRSASAPGERPEPPGKATAAAGTDDDAKSRWTAFLGRQQRYAAQKREGEQARLMRAKSEAGQQPELSQGTRKLSELSAGVENRPNFLQRVAQAFAWTRTTHPRRPSARHLPRPSPRLLAAARRTRSAGERAVGAARNSASLLHRVALLRRRCRRMRLPTARSRRRSTGTRARDVRAPLTNSRRATRSGARRLMQSSSSVRRRRRPRASRSSRRSTRSLACRVDSRFSPSPSRTSHGSVSIWH